MKISTKITKLMENSGLNQKELSDRAGLCRSSISQYLSGKNVPKGKRLEALAEALDVSVEWLKGETEVMENPNKISVKRAAELMGVGQQFIRIGLQRGILPFGYAIKQTGNKFTYYISPKKFTKCTGIEV